MMLFWVSLVLVVNLESVADPISMIISDNKRVSSHAELVGIALLITLALFKLLHNVIDIYTFQ